MDNYLFSQGEQPEKTQKSKTLKWHILIVDDDKNIHDVTKLVLEGKEILGRTISCTSAFSSEQAKTLLMSDTNWACVFIDVVMESTHAGLELVNWIRNTLNNHLVRLLIRTGQAGYAPEQEVIEKYDINDYRTKTELTATKLVSCTYGALRGFRDLNTVEKSLKSFRNLIEVSGDLLKIQNINDFACAALDNFLSLMEVESSAIYIMRHENDIFNQSHKILLASSGRFNELKKANQPFPKNVNAIVEEALSSSHSHFSDDYYVACISTSSDSKAVLYIEFDHQPSDFKASIAELFINNIALMLESLVRQHQTQTTQKELLYIVGDAIEARSKETGSHVKRVAAMAEFIAIKAGLPDSLCDAIRIAAPLHDIGKTTIPDAILHKQGELTQDEFELIKTHAEKGGQLLDKSSMPIAKLGATMARFHHENYDGSGYPQGLKGDDIPLEARIVAIADVIDALGSVRSYKAPWSDDQIRQYVEQNAGIKFDPQFAKIATDHFCELVAIKHQISDDPPFDS
ncbi:HD domain-containing response regulator [Pseudoalteromonas spongiae]|uniref:HD domain-containing response regulator n=1 Tax=Pseudoalteromonas spongiae TaxID=298657 RepID=UPI00026C9086|nr:HD domain-containing response regulator [Pseudoalteromonas spongiae]ATD00994.1 hypothetical protein PSPO_b1079 [Pseudoalteromonas spongiae UST010723-006]